MEEEGGGGAQRRRQKRISNKDAVLEKSRNLQFLKEENDPAHLLTVYNTICLLLLVNVCPSGANREVFILWFHEL